MSLDSIISIAITVESTAVEAANFSTPLIAGYHTNNLDRVREYTALADMLTDGFATTDAIYKAAAKVLSQNPRVSSFKVGRRALAMTQIIEITPLLSDSTEYVATINGIAFAFTSDATATVLEITAGITAAINGGGEPVTAVDNATHVTVTADVAGALFDLALSNDGDVRLWEREDVTADPGIATDLAAILAADSAWYGLTIDSQSKAEISAAAAWIETVKRLFLAASGDTDNLSAAAGSIAKTLYDASYFRTSIMYHDKPHEYAGAAWQGEGFPYDPGSSTWAYKTLTGVTVTAPSTTEKTALESVNANYYIRLGGVGVTLPGKVASGEWIDVVQFIDWFHARLQERIYSKLVNLRKIPFTDKGTGIVESEIWAQINDGVEADGFAATPEPTVTVPAVADVPSASKIARLLPTVAFSATLAGAIHATAISGTVSV